MLHLPDRMRQIKFFCPITIIITTIATTINHSLWSEKPPGLSRYHSGSQMRGLPSKWPHNASAMTHTQRAKETLAIHVQRKRQSRSSKQKDGDVKQSWELHARYNRLFIILPLPVLPIRDYQHALPSSFKVCIFDTLLHNIELLIHSWNIQKHYWVNLLYPCIEHRGNAKTNKIPPKGSWFHSDENNYHTIRLKPVWREGDAAKECLRWAFHPRQGGRLLGKTVKEIEREWGLYQSRESLWGIRMKRVLSMIQVSHQGGSKGTQCRPSQEKPLGYTWKLGHFPDPLGNHILRRA